MLDFLADNWSHIATLFNAIGLVIVAIVKGRRD